MRHIVSKSYNKFIKADMRFIHNMGIKLRAPFCTLMAQKNRMLSLVLQKLFLPAGVELLHTSL